MKAKKQKKEQEEEVIVEQSRPETSSSKEEPVPPPETMLNIEELNVSIHANQEKFRAFFTKSMKEYL